MVNTPSEIEYPEVDVLENMLSYDPEQFGYSKEEVWKYRESLFSSDESVDEFYSKESDGLFLYQWRDISDPSGKECGGYYFSKVPGNGEYYEQITKEEKILFDDDRILKLLSKYSSFIEYGPGLGDANKLRKRVFKNWGFEKFRKDIREKISHFGLDISGYTTEKFSKEYEFSRKVSGEGITTEWSKNTISKKVGGACHIMFGGSVGQYQRYDLINLIKSMSSGSHWKKSPLFLSYFSAPKDPDKQEKIEKIKNAYRTAQAEEFVMKGIASLGIPEGACSYEVDYVEGTGDKPDKIRVGARFKQDYSVDVGYGKTMTKKAGDAIWAVSSRRYTDEQFEGILEEAGVTNIKLHGEGGIKVAESYLPTKKYSEKVQKRANRIGMTLLGTGLLTYGIHKFQENSSYENARDYALEEVAYKNIEHPLDMYNPHMGLKTSFNSNTETREERIDYFVDQVFDIATTEYKNYDFPDDKVVKKTILKLLPKNVEEYFTHSQGPDLHYFDFVNHVLMPHIFTSFDNDDRVGLYDRTKDEEVNKAMKGTRKKYRTFSLNKLESDDILGRGDTQQYQVDNLGSVHYVNEEGILEKAELGLVTITTHKIHGKGFASLIKGDRFLVAGNEKEGYDIMKARKRLDFVDQKGYVPQLINKVTEIIDPLHTCSKYFTMEFERYLVDLNKEGYDFSWMIEGNADKELKRFLGGVLNEDSSLSETLKEVLDKTGVTGIDKNSYKDNLNIFLDFLNTYYGHRHDVRSQSVRDEIGMRNFLTKVLLSDYLDNINSFYSRNDEPLAPQNVHSTLGRLSNKLKEFGYNVEQNHAVIPGLQRLYDNYEQYKSEIAVGMRSFDNNLEDIYIGCVVFTSDGRAFVLNGSYIPTAGFELTKENSYEEVIKKVPEFEQKHALEKFKKPMFELDGVEKRLVTRMALRDIEEVYKLKPTYQAAYEVAKDWKHKFSD